MLHLRVIKCYDLGCNGSEGEEDKAADGVGSRLSVAAADEEDVVLVSACKSGSSRFATSGRGAVITVWELDPSPKRSCRLEKRSVLRGHASSVAAVHFSGDEVVTADRDGVLKLWRISSESGRQASAAVTVRAHEKEVTCLSGRPGRGGGGMILSGSQDKTAKVWSLSSPSPLLSALQGHRRAVTSAAFSEHEDLIATGSSDLTVRLWGSRTFECFKTLEGLASWPTNLAFLDARSLAVSTHAGVLHVASTPTDKMETFDRHPGAIWGLCVYRGMLVTLGEGGEVLFWKDNSEAIAEMKQRMKEEELGQDQTLSNCLHSGNSRKALNLAIKLDRYAKSYLGHV